MDVVSIGEIVIDFLPGKEADSFIATPGGAPANVAIAMSRNNLSVGFIGKVGDDQFGRNLIDTLERDKVAVLNSITTDKAVTTLVFVHLDENKERSFSFVRKPGADMLLDIEDVSPGLLETANIIHAGSCSLSAEPAASATREALRYGHESGRMVSFDLNYRNLMWDDDIDAAMKAVHDVLPYVDMLKISDEERAVFKEFDNVYSFMEHYEISLVLETLGKDGAVCYLEGKRIFMPAYPGPRVDTTGAGDAFWGAFLSTLVIEGLGSMNDVNEKIIRKALAYGNVAGGLCVREKGAISSLPKRDELDRAVNAFIEEGGADV